MVISEWWWIHEDKHRTHGFSAQQIKAYSSDSAATGTGFLSQCWIIKCYICPRNNDDCNLLTFTFKCLSVCGKSFKIGSDIEVSPSPCPLIIISANIFGSLAFLTHKRGYNLNVCIGKSSLAGFHVSNLWLFYFILNWVYLKKKRNE
jgi:hypothetical protein